MEAAGNRSRKRKSAAAGVHGRKPRATVRSATPRPPPGGDGGDGGGAVDRISALPDAVVGEIISLLPTEDGARTQILASRWRHLWRSAPLNLDLHCNRLCNHPQLADTVSRILSSHLASARRFCVNSIPLGAQAGLTMDSWLRSPTLDKLQELEVNNCQNLPLAPIFRFSPTLRILNIGGFLLPEATAQGLQFPQLKQLGLRYVNISECSLCSLIDGCPVLEFLLMQQCKGFCCVRINSLTLRGIVVDNFSNQRFNVHQLNELIIENAPCLERLLLHSRSCVNVSVVAAPKLETVGFLSDKGYLSNSFKDLLNRLEFGSTVIQGLRVNQPAMVVRTVKILAVQMKALSLDTVIGLMTCFPCLEKLYIRAIKSVPNNLWRRKHQNLIKCLDISLKTIVLELYRGIKSQVDFVTFFVQNAGALKLMTLVVDSKHYSEEFLVEQRRKLQLENRASEGAQFNFTTQICLHSSWNLKQVHDFETDPFVWQS